MLASVVVVLGCVGVGRVAVASARDMSRLAPVVIHPRLTRVPGSYFASDGRYVFLGASNSGIYGVGTMLDTHTGRRTSFSRPGCFPTAFGEAWLALDCVASSGALSHELDNVVTGQIRPVSSTVSVPNQSCYTNCVRIVGVGTQWIALEPSQADEHELPMISFQNLRTGETSQDPRTASTNVDLNSARLVTHVCAPVTVPPYQPVYASGDWGSLMPVGGYAVAASSNGMYLKRCGTRLHQLLTPRFPHQCTPISDYCRIPGYGDSYSYCPAFACPPAINAHEVLWRSQISVLNGVFLPSRRRFTITLPAGFGANENLAMALVGTKLYLNVLVGGPPHGVWTIPMPVPPRVPKRHRR